jgi:aminoglycoside phosphotransferase (APT) family kinase protein
MVMPGEPEPTICGVLDYDRASWGDPAFDWAIFLAGMRPGTERDAFWETYGPRASTPAALRRDLYYQAIHIGAARVERHRLGRQTVPATYNQLREVLDGLRA